MVAPPVIVTRAEPGASETAERLARLGFRAISSPMLVLKELDDVAPDLSDVSNLIFTSANGVRFFMQAMGGMTAQLAGLTAWGVGPATNAAIQEAGFGLHVEGDGNAEDLAAMILKSDPDSGGFLHVANSAAAGDLVRRLREGGRMARFQALYETVPAAHLAAKAQQAIQAPDDCIVLIHSAKGAAAFLSAVDKISLETSILIAISEAAAAPLSDAGAKRLLHAERPNEDALMAALDKARQEL
ncbi:uroporphyrinogen-III synthase [Hyphomonas beringensis]|nr:uroporphyrinogen-III synthase [Hyphomonas beringensis]